MQVHIMCFLCRAQTWSAAPKRECALLLSPPEGCCIHSSAIGRRRWSSTCSTQIESVGFGMQATQEAHSQDDGLCCAESDRLASGRWAQQGDRMPHRYCSRVTSAGSPSQAGGPPGAASMVRRWYPGTAAASRQLASLLADTAASVACRGDWQGPSVQQRCLHSEHQPCNQTARPFAESSYLIRRKSWTPRIYQPATHLHQLQVVRMLRAGEVQEGKRILHQRSNIAGICTGIGSAPQRTQQADKCCKALVQCLSENTNGSDLAS